MARPVIRCGLDDHSIHPPSSRGDVRFWGGPWLTVTHSCSYCPASSLVQKRRPSPSIRFSLFSLTTLASLHDPVPHAPRSLLSFTSVHDCVSCPSLTGHRAGHSSGRRLLHLPYRTTALQSSVHSALEVRWTAAAAASDLRRYTPTRSQLLHIPRTTRVSANHTTSILSVRTYTMPRSPEPKRLEPTARSFTWPPTTSTDAQQLSSHKAHHASAVMAPGSDLIQPPGDPFEDELNRHPENYFLSPVQMYEYDDWASDSDDDPEEVAWDAGITDFALFDKDRRRAQEKHEQVPGRWDGLLASQASALHRAVQRRRADSDPKPLPRTPPKDDIPQLTPDNSPDLRDDFDIHAHCRPRPIRPSYLRMKISPPLPHEDEDSFDEDDDDDSDDDDLPVAYLVERARQRRSLARKAERPGLRFSRTMSGKVHVWRRPSSHIYPLGEDAEAERRAELSHAVQQNDDDDVRGRVRR